MERAETMQTQETSRRELSAEGGADNPTEITSMLASRVGYQSTEDTPSAAAWRGPGQAGQPQTNLEMMLDANGDVVGGSENDEETRREARGLRKIMRRVCSIELENKGSTARDHLALGTRILAWLKTNVFALHY